MVKEIIPTGDNLVIEVQRIEKEEETKSGIILTSTKEEVISNIGKVIAIGEGRLLQDGTLSKLNFEKDDKVIFNLFAGTEVEINNKKLLIIKANDILAKIK